MGEEPTIRDYINNMARPKTKEAILAKTAAQMIDPTGISSYPDVAASFMDLLDKPSFANTANFGMEVVGALPLMGKITVPYRAAKAAKLLSKLDDVSDVAKAIDNINGFNKKIDTFSELFPGVRRLAEKTQNLTSRKITDPLFNKWASPNKTQKMIDYRNANTAVDFINTSGTVLDGYQGASQLNEVMKQYLGGTIKRNNESKNRIFI